MLRHVSRRKEMLNSVTKTVYIFLVVRQIELSWVIVDEVEEKKSRGA